VRARLDRLALAVALAAWVCGWLAGPGAAELFWVAGAGWGRIERARNAGTGVDRSFIVGLSDIGTLAVDRRRLYWTSKTAIGRANLSGGGIERAFIPDLGGLNGVAVAGQYVYWLSDHNPACGGKPGFGRARLSGADLQRGFVCGGGPGRGIADTAYVNGLGIAGKYLYWSWITGIGRLDIKRRTYVNRFIVLPPGYTAGGVTVAADHIYWGSYNLGPVIGRANLDGGSADPTFIEGLAGNIAPEVSGFDHRLYFSNDYGSTASIARATLTGPVQWDFITGFRVVGDLTAGPA
jgi:hypothetical protein